MINFAVIFLVDNLYNWHAPVTMATLSTKTICLPPYKIFLLVTWGLTIALGNSPFKTERTDSATLVFNST